MIGRRLFTERERSGKALITVCRETGWLSVLVIASCGILLLNTPHGLVTIRQYIHDLTCLCPVLFIHNAAQAYSLFLPQSCLRSPSRFVAVVALTLRSFCRCAILSAQPFLSRAILKRPPLSTHPS